MANSGSGGGGRRKQASSSSFFSRYGFELLIGAVIFALAAGIWFGLSGWDVEQGEQRIESDVDRVQRPDMIIEEGPPDAASIPPVSRRPRMALIIDDLGADPATAERLLALDAPLAFSILPHQKFSRAVAMNAAGRGMVVMLHLPMEPKSDGADPGPGALSAAQDPAKIIETLRADMESVPQAVGVNNHMGSLFTEDRDKMSIVMREIKRRGLFFIDSRTTPDTVAYDVAVEYGASAASRDIFLDNERDVEKIAGQILLLAREAKEKGGAIGIGHPYPETIAALEKALPQARGMGVDIVPVTELLGANGPEETARLTSR